MTAPTAAADWAAGVPQHMREHPQWVAYGPDPETGRPKCPLIIGATRRRASSTDPTTWRPFAAAVAHYERHVSPTTGVGYVFTPADGLVFIDVDDCLDDDRRLARWAEIVRPLLARTYAEVSPSGHGLHIFARARGPESGRRYPVGDGAIEVYPGGRYSTITADVYGNASEIEDAQAEIDALLAALEPERPPARVIPLRPRRPARPGVGDADAAAWALEQLDPDCSYDMWIRVGMAIHSRWPDEGGLDLWDAWSRGAVGRYPGRHVLERHWRSFGGGGIGLGTLIALGRRAHHE